MLNNIKYKMLFCVLTMLFLINESFSQVVITKIVDKESSSDLTKFLNNINSEEISQLQCKPELTLENFQKDIEGIQALQMCTNMTISKNKKINLKSSDINVEPTSSDYIVCFHYSDGGGVCCGEFGFLSWDTIGGGGYSRYSGSLRDQSACLNRFGAI